MMHHIEFCVPARFNTPATVVLVTKEQLKTGRFSFSQRELSDTIKNVNKAHQFHAENGDIFPLVRGKSTIVLVGVGERTKCTGTHLRILVRNALMSPFLKTSGRVEIIPHDVSDNSIVSVVEAILIGTYQWRKYLSKKKTETIQHEKYYVIAAKNKAVYQEKMCICRAVNFARDLINENADVATALFIEKATRAVSKGKKNVSLTVLNKKQLAAQGLNLHLAVNKGSQYDPRLVIIRYSGGKQSDGYTALVGKGITYDTGGLNLKPTGSMETMKYDMSGAAAVLGIVKAAIDLRLKKNIIGVLGLAENAIGTKSYKPGDVVKSYDGKTVEIGNTDAEGRLVLADALAYVVKNYKPKRIVDFATLTGACVVALGYDYAGLLSNTDSLARALCASAQRTDDRIWQLPLYSELKDHLKSHIADLKNIGLPKGVAGASSAGEFLRQFVGKTPWAHLDIAGPAFVDGAGRMYFGNGATGAGIRLLVDYLQNN